MKIIRAVISLLLASAGFLVAAPAVDVAAIDRERILKAADAALKQPPIAITQPVLWLKP